MAHLLTCLLGCFLALPASAAPTAVKLHMGSTNLPLEIQGLVLAGAQEATQDAEDAPAVEAAEPLPAYGAQSSTAWWFECGVGTNFNEGWSAVGGIGVEWYPVEGFALGLRADGIGVELEDTARTAGGGVALLLRWHVIKRTDWSLYLDGGCGLAYFSSRVPSGATRLNFTPQLGIGCSIACGDQLRLLAGVRWFHISNGQTGDSNPGVDMLNGYIGFTMPF